MARQKKIKTLQEKETPQENMSDTNTLEGTVSENQLVLFNHEELENLESEMDRVRKELEEAKLQLAQKKNELVATPQISEDEKMLIQSRSDKRTASVAAQRKMEIQKAKDNELVTGKFINRRAPGQSVKLTYMRYQDDPVKWYTFNDGGVYTIKRGFSDEINEHYHTPHFIQKQGDQNLGGQLGENSAISHVDRSNKKYAFIPLSF